MKNDRIRSGLFALAWISGLSVVSVVADDTFDPFSDEVSQALATEAAATGQALPGFLAAREIEALTETVKPALVTVTQMGRDGETRGTGAGFLISEDGLVVTNLHVTGEGRPVEVGLVDGSKHRVVEIYASDRRYDLVVMRIESKGRKFSHLKLKDSDEVKQGEIIAGFGTPQGLSFSVVPGVVSAIRKLDQDFMGEETPDYPMLQLAMPIEQGNSGGPVVNLEGEVVGVVTLRHRVTQNLGFAVLSNDVARLLSKPNPIPINRWQTLGELDPQRWTVLMGGSWSKRGNVVSVTQSGDGFGGRAVCLASDPVPDEAYEVSVKVKLNDESGAAGIVFAADDGDRHYGLYPSAGKLRFTRFEGPNVHHWTILEQLTVPTYIRGGWNELKVRVDQEGIIAWVNGTEALRSSDTVLRGTRAGLCKFRQTEAQFKSFRVSQVGANSTLSDDELKGVMQELKGFVEEGKQDQEGVLSALGQIGDQAAPLIGERIRTLEEEIAALRGLEKIHHQRQIENAILMALDRPESEIDLFEVGLLVAKLDQVDLDESYYRDEFSALVKEAKDFLGQQAAGGQHEDKVRGLTQFLFVENGFHGARSEYYHHANSYVTRVLDDREGIPITLSLIFIEMARRLGVEHVAGVALPGKFMVKVGRETPAEKAAAESATPPYFIDVFEAGKAVSFDELRTDLTQYLGSAPPEGTYLTVGAKEITLRMLRNLIDIEINRKERPEEALDYLNLVLAIDPTASGERFQRALVCVAQEDMQGALADLDWLLEYRPAGIDYRRLEMFRASLDQR